MRYLVCLLLVWFMAAPVRAFGQVALPPADQHGFIPIQVAGPGIFRMKDMQIHKKARTLTFPARVRSHAGPLAYLLVHSASLLENSLLETDFRPYDFHIACALLGLSVREKGDATGRRNAAVQGSPVQVRIRIISRQNSRTLKEPAGAWLAASGSKKDMEDMADLTWVYYGAHEKIAAPAPPDHKGNKSGAVIALAPAPDALIQAESEAVTENNSHKQWGVHPDRSVTPGTAVTVVVKFITGD